MTLENWLSLAAAVIPSVLIWVFRNGTKEQRVADLGKDLTAFREDLSEFRDENREQARELYQEFKAAQVAAHALEARLVKLETWRHATSNQLQVLTGQVDDLRVRKN